MWGVGVVELKGAITFREETEGNPNMEGGSLNMDAVVPDPPLVGEEVLPESLCLHATLPTQTVAKHSRYHCIQPKNAISRTGTILFEVLSGDNKFIDVASTMLYVECSVRDNASEVIPTRIPNPVGAGAPVFNPKAKTVPTNGIGHTIFTNLKVSLNGTQIDLGSTLYLYRGDLEAHLSYPSWVKEGCLDMTGFDEEVVAFENVNNAHLLFEEIVDGDTTPSDTHHPPIHCRYQLSRESRTMYIMTPLHSEIFDQGKWLPPPPHS